MTALLYFIVAVLAATLAIRAWLPARQERVRLAYLGLGLSLAITYVSFSLSLLPGLEGLRLLYLLVGTQVPAFGLWCVDRLFALEDGRPSLYIKRTFAASAIIGVGATGVDALLYPTQTYRSPPELVAGVYVFAAFFLVLWRLWEAYDAAELQVDRARLRYLLGMAAGAVVFTILEQIGRQWGGPIVVEGLPIASRTVALQGALPPISCLFTGMAIYFLYHSIVMSRLLDLNEMFSRATALALSAWILVLVDGITVLWVGTFTDHPLHSTFQVFLGSVFFLAAYDPVREQVHWWSNRVFNQRGQQLQDVLLELRMDLPTMISTKALQDALLSRLQASGRVPVISLYLWDEKLDAFACVGHRGFGEERPLAAVAAHPFVDFFADGEPWYFRATVARLARLDRRWAEILELMNAMKSDLALPFVARNLVLGWIQLRDEDWSDGYSADEIQRLSDIADLAGVVLSNIHDFQALEEEHRLAALGAMAAGLAHEIRNPLAGIKGAAQYLQGETLGADAQEMLTVVLDEADRLNAVVTQFLDYARPFELMLAPDHVNALVAHGLALLRAQGVGKDVKLVEDLAGDLPSLPLDRVKLSQVLVNLLQNALQAMPEGGTLTVSTRKRAGRSGAPEVEIAVADTGIGIAPEDMEKLFIPFFTTKQDGTGLGLAISQRIVQAHGGEMDVLSAPGRGATFLVRLPLPQAPAAEEAAS